MTVKPEQVIDGAMAFVEGEMLPTLEGWKAWAASAAMVQLYQSAGKALPELLNNKTVAALGLVDESGMIDIDAAVNVMKETARKKGKLELDIPLLGKFRLDENDFDKLAEYIKKSEM